MAIDYEAIRTKLIAVARAGVGTSLSLGGPTGILPNVIVRRPDAEKPDYPYVDLDILDTKDEHGWLTNEEVDGNDNPIYETVKQLLITYRVYGGDAINIANDLHGYFRLSSVRDDIRSTLGGSIVSIFDVDNLPVPLVDRFLESSSFNLIFNITDTLADTGTGILDTIHLDGELARYDDDPAPLPIIIDAP